MKRSKESTGLLISLYRFFPDLEITLNIVSNASTDDASLRRRLSLVWTECSMKKACAPCKRHFQYHEYLEKLWADMYRMVVFVTKTLHMSFYPDLLIYFNQKAISRSPWHDVLDDFIDKKPGDRKNSPLHLLSTFYKSHQETNNYFLK